jgi:voltage-gated potassium channel
VLFSGLTFTFLKQFFLGVWLTAPMLLCLGTVIGLLGKIAGNIEGWGTFESLYWSFITATTVGYGDIRPVKHSSRMIAIGVALLGLVMTGIEIAVAVHAATQALTAHDAAAFKQ